MSNLVRPAIGSAKKSPLRRELFDSTEKLAIGGHQSAKRASFAEESDEESSDHTDSTDEKSRQSANNVDEPGVLESDGLIFPHAYDTRSRCRKQPQHLEPTKKLGKTASPARKEALKEQLIYEKREVNMIHIAFIFVVVLLVLYCTICKFWPENEQPRHTNFVTLLDDMKLLQSSYPNLDKSLWLMIRASIRSSFDTENPIRPAILTLIGSEHIIYSMEKFANHLAETVSAKFPPLTKYKSLNFSTFDCRDYANNNHIGVRKVLDEFFLKAFDRDLFRVALLKRIDLLPGASPLALNLHCDDSVAPFKNVFIILTLICPAEIFEKFSKRENLADECLGGQWANNPAMNKDKIGALVSRLGAFSYVSNDTF